MGELNDLENLLDDLDKLIQESKTEDAHSEEGFLGIASRPTVSDTTPSKNCNPSPKPILPIISESIISNTSSPIKSNNASSVNISSQQPSQPATATIPPKQQQQQTFTDVSSPTKATVRSNAFVGSTTEAKTNIISEGNSTLDALNGKLMQVEQEKKFIEEQIKQSEKQKQHLIENEEYDHAQQLKIQLQQLQENLKQKEIQIGKLRQGIEAQNALQYQQAQQRRTPEVTTSSIVQSSKPTKILNSERIEEVFQKKRNELQLLKQKAIDSEDYDTANYYKQQIQQLEENFRKDMENVSAKQRKDALNEPPPSATMASANSTSNRSNSITNDSGHTNSNVSTNKIATTRATMYGTQRKTVQYPQDSRLYDAARATRVSEVLSLLNESKLDVNTIDFNTGNTALHAAVTVSNPLLVKLLVDRGANCNIRNRRGQTPMHLAVEKRNDEITEYLMEKGGVDLKIEDNTGNNPLDLAAKRSAIYQEKLKEFYMQLLEKRKIETKEQEAQRSKEEKMQSLKETCETVPFYLRTGNYHTFVITEKDQASVALKLMSEKIKLVDILDDLELTEEIVGKERKLKDTELILASMAKWPNNNPTYCRFVVKLKRGSPEKSQMRFRETLYGK